MEPMKVEAFRMLVRALELLLCTVLVGCVAPTSLSQTRIAVIGDSNVNGATLPDAKRDGFVAVMERLLGPEWLIRPFGINGATVNLNSDMAYLKRVNMDGIRAFRPHLVVVLLGTNDALSPEPVKRAELVWGYEHLVERLGSRTPGMVICQPPLITRPGDYNQALTGTVYGAISEVAPRFNGLIVAFSAELTDMPGLLTDGVHLNVAGHAKLAESIVKAIRQSNIKATAWQNYWDMVKHDRRLY